MMLVKELSRAGGAVLLRPDASVSLVSPLGAYTIPTTPTRTPVRL